MCLMCYKVRNFSNKLEREGRYVWGGGGVWVCGSCVCGGA